MNTLSQKTSIPGKYLVLIVTLTLAFLVLGLLVWFVVGPVAVIITLVVALGLILTLQLALFFKLAKTMQQTSQNNYQQLEALATLVPVLKLRQPLPPMGGWAISPDFARLLAVVVNQQKPKIIVELGSGVSSIISGYCLEQLGCGHVLSLEHEQKYAEISRQNLASHGLDSLVTVTHAPLKSLALPRGEWLWYDLSVVEEMLAGAPSIDLLVVDAPPGMLQPLSRYPALPVLAKYLSQDAVILLDDSNRWEEQKIIQMWQTEFPGWEQEQFPCEKGAVILRRSPKA